MSFGISTHSTAALGKRNEEELKMIKERKKGVPGVAAMNGIVTINVGPTPVKFQVHTHLLIYHSEYFRRALTGCWKEAEERVVKLEDVQPSTFSMFVNWLYTRRVPYSTTEWEDMETFGAYPTTSSRLRELICAYALGDRLIVPNFCHAANNRFDHTFRRYTSRPARSRRLVSLAFSTLPSDCILLQNLVDGYCERWDKADEDYRVKAQSELPLDFLRRVMHRLHESSKMTEEEKRHKRCYQEHSYGPSSAMCFKRHMHWDAEEELGFFE